MGTRRAIAFAFFLGVSGFGLSLGAKDHPLIKPYAGSGPPSREFFEFDESTIPLGPTTKDGILTKSQRLEGKITKLNYANPAGRSTLEIFRNYETALKQGGFEMLYACIAQPPTAGPDSCGPGTATVPGWFGNRGWPYSSPLKPRYLAARLSRSEGDVWVALEVRPANTLILLVETKAMETRMVTVNAAALAGDITRVGHVAVYGIYFDTGKADIKPESEPVLQQIAKLVKENAALKLHVVGHTDNVGALAMNLDLSRRRAASVVQALTTKFGIAAARLHAEGVGPLGPVATNKSEEGRAKNRRVELVEQ